MAEPFQRADPDIHLPSLEEAILELWASTDAFAASISSRPPEHEYTFYDGPPFASGSPHYGHILAGVLKDVVPRYWTMKGHRIERRFGWDTHGLPVEIEVERLLGVHGPRQIEAFGVTRFNEACRRLVEETAEEWEYITRRIGRWVDMEDDYKTMDLPYMESVWWVFAELWKRGLVYRAYKVVPYSWGAATVLSNWEASEEYKDVDDPSVTFRVRVAADQGPARAGDWLLLWTTTPWTLPGNLAVAVGPDIGYAVVAADGERYWVAEALAGRYWEDPSLVQRATGTELIGTRYEPVFGYFAGLAAQGAFRVIASPDVVVGEGTGLVHMAPAHGEEDFAAAQANGLELVVDPTDEEGRFTEAVPDVAGMNIKDADPILVDLLRNRGNLVRYQRIRHSYPFCPRTHTPLMYKPISTWFVRVEALRDRMVELNRSIHWVPDHVGSRRFHNWLEGARDWAVSRNRYWGTTIPVWSCDSCEEQLAVGSLDELEQLSGMRPNDLHKHVVDEIGFRCSSCEGTMTRTPEVLDTWFDAGSMPYAQIHYPFENRERFARRFPADFIAEGLDQTRGWFYTLLILSTALFDERAFQNCVVNGLILAEDGRKLSKRLKNYPDPRHILDEYGADALRIYLFDSPVLRGEPLRFAEQGVRSVVRSTLLPLWNAYSFFTTYAAADGISGEDLSGAPPVGDRPELDRWILSVLQSLIGQVTVLMRGYYLSAVVPPMVRFIDDLTNWYIRRSRRRFWRSRSEDDTDKLAAFATLHEVLVTFSKVIAPVAPFLSEHLYQALVVAHNQGTVPGSVHLCDYPEAKDELVDLPLEAAMSHVQTVVRLGHSLRKKVAIRVRQPVRLVTIVTRDRAASAAVSGHVDLIREELNAREVAISNDESAFVDLSAKANFKLLGPRLGAGVGPVAEAIQDLDQGAIRALIEGGSIDLDDHVISPDDVVIGRNPRSGMTVASEGELSVVLDTAITDELAREGLAREMVARIQQLRRDQGLAVTDRIRVWWDSSSQDLVDAVQEHREWIAGEVLASSFERRPADSHPIEVGDLRIEITISAV